MSSQFDQFFNWVTGANTARVLVQDEAFSLVMEGRNTSQSNAEIAYLSIESM